VCSSEHAAPRVLRVDRFEAMPQPGPEGSARLPQGFDADGALPDDPWRIGEGEPVTVDVLVDEPMARLVVERDVDEKAVIERRPSGSVVVRLEATNVGALRSWVLGLGPQAEVLSPPEVRADMIAWLESTLIATAPGPVGGDAGP